MKSLLWRIRAVYWFWRLARFPSWEAATVCHDGFIEVDSDYSFWTPEQAVREELSNWG
jgi:hypothetical protein